MINNLQRLSLKIIVGAIIGAIFLATTNQVLAAMSLSFNDSPTSVNEDDQFEVIVSLISAPKDTIYYLRGALFEAGKTSYFGYTYNHLNEWHNSPSEATKFFEITTSPEGSWSGKLKAKADLDSSYFKGEGEYQFKIGRYTSSGNFGSWSENIEVINILYTPPPSPSPSPSPNPSPTPTPSPSLIPSPSPEGVIPSFKPKILKSTESDLMLLASHSGEVRGASESSEASESSQSAKNKKPLILAIALIVLGLGLVGGTGVAFYKEQRYNELDANTDKDA